jgi:mono/diheme cytochrome c family protein
MGKVSNAALLPLALAGLLVAGPLVAAADAQGQSQPSQRTDGGQAATGDDHGHAGHGGHHVPVPAEYVSAHAPTAVWTDSRTIEHGKELYEARCATCHGTRGDGKGPAAATLALKPADFTDAAGVAEMTESYWFWRVSEGGQVEPFKSQGSVMPAWKETLSVDDRWAVIAYQHTLSGHVGPHTENEHQVPRGRGRRPR